METLVPTLAGLALMAAVVYLFRRVVRAPRGISREDPPGIRSVAVFRGEAPDLFADDRADEPYVGVRLFRQLCAALSARGVVIEQTGPVQNAQGARCVVDGEPLGVVLEWVEGQWALSVEWVPRSKAEVRHVLLAQEFYAPADTIALRRLLAWLDGWLKGHPKLSDVGWRRKEDWMDQRPSAPAATPFDGEPPS
jgi:hypothetical protein